MRRIAGLTLLVAFALTAAARVTGRKRLRLHRQPASAKREAAEVLRIKRVGVGPHAQVINGSLTSKPSPPTRWLVGRPAAPSTSARPSTSRSSSPARALEPAGVGGSYIQPVKFKTPALRRSADRASPSCATARASRCRSPTMRTSACASIRRQRSTRRWCSPVTA